jgi:hypothetical protein
MSLKHHAVWGCRLASINEMKTTGLAMPRQAATEK